MTSNHIGSCEDGNEDDVVKALASEVRSAQISEQRKVTIIDLHVKDPIKNQYLKISSLHLNSENKE